MALDVAEVARRAEPTEAAPRRRITIAPVPDEGPVSTIYCRAPLELADRLRDLAREKSRGRGGKHKVTVNDLVIQAVEDLLEKEGASTRQAGEGAAHGE